MMKPNRRRMLLACLACAMLPACASLAPGEGSEVRIYPTAQLRAGQYTLVKRLWVESGRSAFFVPEYASAAQGIDALRAEAARLGANGLTTVACYGDEKGQVPLAWKQGPVFICYGNAIRVQENPS